MQGYLLSGRHTYIYLYDIATDHTTVIPRPSRRYDYQPALEDPNPAVMGDEVVYFFRAGHSCGSHVHLISVPVSSAGSRGAQTAAYALAVGRDASTDPYIDDTGGQTDVYLSQYNCRTKDSNILKLDGLP